MGLDKGMLYLAFGETYDMVAAHSIRYSRKFTNLPICVLTNLNDSQRHSLWKDVDNIQFIELDIPTDYNRSVKTSLIEYTPFNQTIFIDCDAVVQNPGIEKVFRFLDDCDVAFRKLRTLKCDYDKKLFMREHYVPVLDKLGFFPPMQIYSSGMFLFQKNERVRELFDCWNRFWLQGTGGTGRDMPPLTCAIHKFISEGKVKLFPIDSKDLVFDLGNKKNCYDRGAIIQHRYRTDEKETFFIRFSIPEYVAYKPFDR